MQHDSVPPDIIIKLLHKICIKFQLVLSIYLRGYEKTPRPKPIPNLFTNDRTDYVNGEDTHEPVAYDTTVPVLICEDDVTTE